MGAKHSTDYVVEEDSGRRRGEPALKIETFRSQICLNFFVRLRKRAKTETELSSAELFCLDFRLGPGRVAVVLVECFVLLFS